MYVGLNNLDAYEFAAAQLNGFSDYETDELCDDEDCHATGVCIC